MTGKIANYARDKCATNWFNLLRPSQSDGAHNRKIVQIGQKFMTENVTFVHSNDMVQHQLDYRQLGQS